MQKVEERLSALGNCIACNDYATTLRPLSWWPRGSLRYRGTVPKNDNDDDDDDDDDDAAGGGGGGGGHCH